MMVAPSEQLFGRTTCERVVEITTEMKHQMSHRKALLIQLVIKIVGVCSTVILHYSVAVSWQSANTPKCYEI